MTGEAFPIHKKAFGSNPFFLADEDAVLVDPTTLGYAGTRALTGIGSMRVLSTGQQTSYGAIVQSVSTLIHERTPLQKSISKLVQYLIVASAFLCLALAGVRLYQGHGWLDALLSAATLAIAAIPEEFPIVFTFFLGVGVYRLAKRHALVRRAVSVENIGRVTHICTDKTGTITFGVLNLTHIDPVSSLDEAAVLAFALAASDPEGSDPVDLAIRSAASQRQVLSQRRLQSFPFTEDRKQETAFLQRNDGKVVAYMKGAPEIVITKSNLEEEPRRQWKERTTNWAQSGHKVLACARKVLGEGEFDQGKEPESGFEFCGLLAFEDPPRPEAVEAMNYCHRNGIRVLMMTGDHPETALAIAKEVGLGGPSPIVVSAEDEPEHFLEIWLDKNPEFLLDLHVVARCTPLQKLRIVNALKKSGELVAVTGDGVNDVPALKAADIGIAMGERGTRSAKEVSSIVLAEDNFRTIVGAIMEGKQLFKNLKLSFKYLLLIHIPFVLTAAAIPLLGYPLLYLPVHVVWLELVIHPSALFAFQQKATADSDRVYGEKSFFTTSEFLIILSVGILAAVVLALIFSVGLNENSEIGHARAKAMALLVIWSSGLVTYFSRLKTWAATSIAIGTLVSAVIATEIPSLARTLQLAPLNLSDWAMAAGAVCSFLLIMRTGELMLSRFERQPPRREEYSRSTRQRAK